jgi:hypothetical protein
MFIFHHARSPANAGIQLQYMIWAEDKNRDATFHAKGAKVSGRCVKRKASSKEGGPSN